MPSILDRITIETRCDVEWDTMKPVDPTGADRVRHCGECRLNVFNLSEMTRAEAEAVLESGFATGQRVCTQFIRRKDGTILTADCLTARERIRSRTRRVRVAAAALMAMILPAFAAGCGAQDSGSQTSGMGGSAAPARPDPSAGVGGITTCPPAQVPHDPEEHPLRGDTTDPLPKPPTPPVPPETLPTKGETFVGRIAVAPTPVPDPKTPKDGEAK